MGFQQVPAGLVLSGDLAGAYTLSGEITVGTAGGMRVVVDGARDALLFYDSTNTLVAALAPSGGTDAAGTAYPTGLKVGKAANPGVVVGYSGNTGLIYFPSIVPNVQLNAKIQDNQQGTGTAEVDFLTVGSAVDATQKDGAFLNLFASSADGTQTAHATLSYQDPTGGVHSYVQSTAQGALVTGVVTGLHPGSYSRSSPAVAESWQTPTLGSGWSTGTVTGGVRSIHYRIDADGFGVMIGTFHSTGATPAATIFTLPSGYYDPTDEQPIPVMVNSSGTMSSNGLLISSTGAVSLVTNLTASGVDVWVCARYRVS